MQTQDLDDGDELSRDAELIARVQVGDSSAFEEIYQILNGPIFTYLFNQIRRWHIAEDVLQMVFLRLHHAIAVTRRPINTTLRAYCFGIARNEIVNYLRREAKSCIGDVHLDSIDECERCHDPSANAQLDAAIVWVREAIVELPERDQAMILLKFWRNQSIATTSQQVDLSPRRVHQCLNEIFGKLRRRFDMEFG